MEDYVELTSFTHKPYYETFSPEVPDNWENQPMYNLPLDELIGAIDYALNKGYTVCWDGDVSEQGFSFKNGIAINPQVEDVKDYSTTDRARFEKMPKYQRMDEVFKFEHPYPEINVTPEIRQDGYEKFVTTDDHLMHITGIVKDQNDTKYYITKNSWGAESNKSGGYLNMSESYVRAKTICVMVHKDSLPKELKKKLGIQLIACNQSRREIDCFIHLFIRNSPLYSYNKRNRATKYHYFTALFFLLTYYIKSFALYFFFNVTSLISTLPPLFWERIAT